MFRIDRSSKPLDSSPVSRDPPPREAAGEPAFSCPANAARGRGLFASRPERKVGQRRRSAWPQVSRAGPARPGPAGGALTLQAVKPATLCSPAVALGFLGGDLGARCQPHRRSEIREPLALRRPSAAATRDVCGSFIGFLLCPPVRRSASPTAAECWARPRSAPLWVTGAR